MTGQGNTILSENDILIAGEFALGLLDAKEHAEAEARFAADPVFAAEVMAWEERLRPLLAQDNAQPAPDMFDRIAARLPANDDHAGDQDRFAGTTAQGGNVRWWQAISGAAIAASLVMAVMLFNAPQPAPIPGPAAPVLVAALSGKAGPQAMTARYDPMAGELLITPVAVDTKERDTELWVINADGKPQSLGVVSQERSSRIVLNAALRGRMIAGATLAVTEEPLGGSPTGQPTGAIILSGAIQTL